MRGAWLYSCCIFLPTRFSATRREWNSCVLWVSWVACIYVYVNELLLLRVVLLDWVNLEFCFRIDVCFFFLVDGSCCLYDMDIEFSQLRLCTLQLSLHRVYNSMRYWWSIYRRKINKFRRECIVRNSTFRHGYENRLFTSREVIRVV